MIQSAVYATGIPECLTNHSFEHIFLGLIKNYLDIFPKEDIQTATKHVKRCSALLMIREMPIKTTMRCYLTHLDDSLITNGLCYTITCSSSFSSFGYRPRSEIAGLRGNSVFKFLRNYHIFHSDCTVLHFHYHHSSVPLSPYPHQHLPV